MSVIILRYFGAIFSSSTSWHVHVFESWRKVAVPMGKVAKGLVFVRFQRDVAAFSVAGVALRDMLVESCRTYGKRCKKRCL